MSKPRLSERIDNWLGPPQAFGKALASFAFLFIASYVFAFPKIHPTWVGLMGGFTILGIVGGALLAGLLLATASCYDLYRNAKRKTPHDSFLAVLAFMLGFLLLDSLNQLAAESKAAFLEMFATTLVGLLVAFAIESKVFGKPRTRRRPHTPK